MTSESAYITRAGEEIGVRREPGLGEARPGENRAGSLCAPRPEFASRRSGFAPIFFVGM